VQELREPLDAFQLDQLKRIFDILGVPSVETWPALEQSSHWQNNSQGVRSVKAEHAPRLEEHLIAQNPDLASDPRKDAAVDLLKR
jgi:hypothetical protein